MSFPKVCLFAAGIFAASSGAALACTDWGRDNSGLGQAWPQADRDVWYSESQGSRLIPKDWFYALPTMAGDGLFSDVRNLSQYTDQICSETGLPIGFVVDAPKDRVPAIGLTCVACHTGVLDDGKSQFIVEGGASNLEFQKFSADVFSAVDAVFKDGGIEPGARWQAFAGGILGADHSEEQATNLHVELRKWLQKRHKIQRSIDHGGDWGPGRTDAVAVILNTASVLSGVRAGVDLLPATAPVSIPHVWNAPQMRQVQWNGSSTKLVDVGLFDSVEMGAVTRNVAEVLGVFAEIELTTDDLADNSTYPSLTSSVRLDGLVRLERSLETLPSPTWPAAWGPVDINGAEYLRGQTLYAQNCQGCHSLIAPGDLVTLVEQEPSDTSPYTLLIPAFDINSPFAQSGLGTDPMMACNALTHTSWSGKFEDLHDSFGSFRRLTGNWDLTALSPDKFPKGIVTLRLVEELALRMIYEKSEQLSAVQREDLSDRATGFFNAVVGGIFGSDDNQNVDPSGGVDVPEPGSHLATSLIEARQLCASAIKAQKAKGLPISIPAYKARPLNGIFATAPYLHNGSVPTLDDLLRPAQDRPLSFPVGRVLYDTVRLGTGAKKSGTPDRFFHVQDADGQTIPGNSNAGHEFPPSMACVTDPSGAQCDSDRAALLVYLKTL